MLRQDGVCVPISTLTTKVYDKLLDGFDVLQRTGDVKNILFLARVEKEKGIYMAIETYLLLKQKFPYLKLTIVGGGSELENVTEYIIEKQLPDISIRGTLNGGSLIEAYRNSSLYLFPTFHGEGMPTSVLEAMAFGLPVITRKVGGLADFFEDGKMGYITESYDPKDFSDAIERYIKDEGLTRRVSLYNYQYAKEHFYASKVAQKMEKTVKSFIYG